MATLKTLVNAMNADLQRMIGSTVQSALEVCTTVRGNIMNGEFFATLVSNKMQDMIVFRDGIEDLQYIFLKTSDSEMRKIIKINVSISYFNETATEDGGILSVLSCELVGFGEEMKDVSLTELAIIAQLSSIRKRKEELQSKLTEYQKKVKMLTTELEHLSSEETQLEASLKNNRNNNPSPAPKAEDANA